MGAYTRMSTGRLNALNGFIFGSGPEFLFQPLMILLCSAGHYLDWAYALLLIKRNIRQFHPTADGLSRFFVGRRGINFGFLPNLMAPNV